MSHLLFSGSFPGAAFCVALLMSGPLAHADGNDAAPPPVQMPQWQGTLKDGTLITEDQLKEMTSSHVLRTLITKKRSPKVDLSGANIGLADLKRAHLDSANLSGAIMAAVDLTEANLRNADLRGANLWGANLSGATLNHAKLGGANLYEAKMSDAVMIGTDLSNAAFELIPGTLPSIQYVASATGLAEMRYEHSPTALIELREAFRTAGLREQADEVNFAIMHSRRIHAGFFEKIPLLAVEIPCAYGLRPGRPLLILLTAVLIFWIPYIFALNKGGSAGIWMTWPADRTPRDESTEKDARLSPSGFRRLGVAFYFSVISAFNIGWEEINIGSWIARIQPKEFTLKAIGWVRVVAGVQSLLGVYMVALSILSYFGHLFE